MKKSFIMLLLIFIIISAMYFLVSGLQPKDKIYTIAVINYSPAAESTLEGLLEGLADYGYVKDKNLKIIYDGFKKDKDELKHEAFRLAALEPDLIFAMSTPAALAAKAATKDNKIPVVFGPVSAPVETGVVDNFRQPEGNMTGVTFGPQEAIRLEMLLKIKPDVRNILVPYNPNDKSPRVAVENLKIAAQNLGVNLLLLEITSEMVLTEKLYGFKGDFDAVYIPTDALMVAQSDKVAQYAILKKVPYTCPQKEGVRTGALFSYGFSIRDLGKQAARIVHMVLSGTKPGDIPVEISEFSLSINLDTAEKIKIEIPEFLLKNSFIVRQ